MNDKTKDPFARWWWPGQWLHIVYGVWIDQLWYWQNVRPLLTKENKKQGRSLYVQGTLGIILISVVVMILVGGILIASGVPLNLADFLIGSVVGVIGCACINLPLLGLANGLPGIVAGGIFLGLCVGGLAAISPDVFTSVIVTMAVLDGTILGISLGVYTGASTGQRSVFVVLIGLFPIILIFSAAAKNVLVGILAGIISSPIGYLGNRWATRQVPDDATRMRLANPDKYEIPFTPS